MEQMYPAPLNNPFKFRNDKDRLQSGQERSKTETWLKTHVLDMVQLHQNIKRGKDLTISERNLLDIILNATICNVYHDDAEDKFMMEVS